ncbi:MAG: peptidoglycan bridge formation glycyltransferase FemA/FemB family protein [Candidatus Staskawiczbacteria bacterium]|nr:peptidoglycan bridge formation glycyltransferase FemA/FemB family protein [Candidatus Staskawiczbacteria bacterium]
MEAIFCENKNKWNKFIFQNSNSFLQSFEWGDFQDKFGRKVFRLMVEENGEILVEVQILKYHFLFKNYFYIPYGPIFKNNIIEQSKEANKVLIDKIYELSKQENCFFLHVEPFSKIDKVGIKSFNSIRRIQPKKTLVLDLTKSEEELFKSFSRTTKYNIGLAKRRGVKINREKEYQNDFYKLMEQTKERQEFGIHSDEYYNNILKLRGESIKSELFFAEYEDKKINATIMLFFGDTATTLHAGSDYNYRQIKGANLLEWEMILAVKSEGYKKFDFWGVDDKKWPGLTAFKKGFGGLEIEYPEGVDIVFQNFWYSAYKIFKSIKK